MMDATQSATLQALVIMQMMAIFLCIDNALLFRTEDQSGTRAQSSKRARQMHGGFIFYSFRAALYLEAAPF